MVQGEEVVQVNPASPTSLPTTNTLPADADWISVLPDARAIFVAGGILFLLGHGGILFGKPPAGPLAFLITCFIWGVLFGYPAFLAFQKRCRAVTTTIATLFLLVAGLDLAVPVYIHYETEPLLREPRTQLPQPMTPEAFADAAWPMKDAMTLLDDAMADFNRVSGAPPVRGRVNGIDPATDPIGAAMRLPVGKLVPSETPGAPGLSVKHHLALRLRQERPWAQVERELKAAEIDPELYRKQYQQYQLDIARNRRVLQGESRLEYVVRRAIPLSSAIGQLKRAEQYTSALKRLNARTASQEDIDVVVRYELLEEINPQAENVR